MKKLLCMILGHRYKSYRFVKICQRCELVVWANAEVYGCTQVFNNASIWTNAYIYDDIQKDAVLERED